MMAPRRSPAAVTGVLLGHGALLWLLMQAAPLRETWVQVAPLVVSLVASETPPAPHPPQPMKLAAPTAPVAPAAPVPFVVVADAPPAPMPAAPTPAPTPVAAPVTLVLTPSSPASAPAQAQAAAPKTMPADAVRYLVPPAPAYPLLSRRLRETGTVLLQVLVDADGRPSQVRLLRSSGFERLDLAAVDAMRRARFKPHLDNGVAQAVWAPAPIVFEL